MMAKEEAEEKLKAQWAKAELDVDWMFSFEDQQEVMQIISNAAKTFQKGGPGAPTLEAWEVHTFTPGVFKEMLKRTFNIILSPKQLAGVIRQFDTNGMAKSEPRILSSTS
jgi:hypothetical protein